MNVAEIEIVRTIGSRHTPRTLAQGESLDEMLRAADVIGELRAARDRGVRTLLVTASGPGGVLDDSFAIYDALRAFPSRGGRVVVHVVEEAWSSAVFIALAGDWIVMDPAAVFVLHAMHGYTEEAHRTANERVCSIYRERTCTPPEHPDRWLAQSLAAGPDGDWFEKIPADADAWRFGWIDEIGNAEYARRVAATGYTTWTPRQSALIQRRAACG
ncbi:MAG: ATP-dependent Clp protease proteolytic subunit [Myxococcales bacterium]